MRKYGSPALRILANNSNFYIAIINYCESDGFPAYVQ